MAGILVNTAQVSAVLRDAATTLKAAIVVAAAAILSRAESDLEANAAAASSHLDAFRDKLAACHDGILRDSGNAKALAVISSAGTAEVDIKDLNARIAAIDGLIESFKQALFVVVSSDEREGIAEFAEHAGALGGAFAEISFSAGQAGAATPFRCDQFFLETMHDLGQRDWSEGA